MLSQLDQAGHTAGVALDQVVLQLDKRVVRAEQVAQALHGLLRGVEALAGDQLRTLTMATAAQRDEALGVRRQVGRIECRWSRVVRGQVSCRWLPRAGSLVGQGDQAAQVGVALLAFSQQRQVDGAAALVEQAMRQGELNAHDRLHAGRGAGLGELHRAVQAVMVGDRQRAVAKIRRAQRQLLGQRGTLEERKTGVQV